MIRRLFLACLMAACALAATPASAQNADIRLWPRAAPGPTAPAGAETVRVTEQGEHVVSNVTVPSLRAYLPAPDRATGAAIIIAPGGGHRELWIDHEGYRVAEFMQAHGVAAFVLKYRLANAPSSPYKVEPDALADIRRAIRTVRARAGEYRVRREAVGVLGFSAGGNLAALAAWRSINPVNSRDPIDAQDARPSFAVLVYPGIPEHAPLTAATPPMYLVAGDQDRDTISIGLADLYLEAKRAGASAELHMLAGVPHGFGIRATNAPQIASWPQSVVDWMSAKGFLAANPAQ